MEELEQTLKLAEPSQKTTRKLLCGSVALIALVLTSCTSTGNGNSPLQMTNSADGSIIADTLQSAADQTIAAEAAQTGAATQTQKPTAVAEAKPVENSTKAVASATSTTGTASQAPDSSVQVAALATESKPSSLFSIFGKKPTESPAETATATEAKKPDQKAEEQTAATPEAKPEAKAEAAEAKQPETPKPAEPEKPVQVASLFGSAKNANAYVAPQSPATAGQGSIARLFNDEDAGNSKNKKLAVVRPNTKSTRDYNYSLPGVRPNGGFEIKHRKSIYDDSDIDANEYDDYASVQLASAPGLARLAPNGLKVQRETVDVACLKPQLVTMLKTMERHFRRPVMITSGYRSPSYNRKVNGARKSLHMICAAADIQISGVSKHEIARFARNMPGRGGVGTYCHTTAVHVDVGPERDWNWSCKK